MELFVIVVIWLGLCGAVAGLADSRGRSAFGFFLLSFLLSPLLGLAVVLVTTNLKEEERKAEAQRREHERQLESLRVIAKPPASPPMQAPASPAPRSVADEIEKLGELKAKGLLTDDEFTAQKTQLLRT